MISPQAAYFLRLGATGFGGPIALVDRMERDLVAERGWYTPEEFGRGLALAQVAPGPLAAQLASKQGQYGELRTRLQVANPEYASLTSVDPLALSQVQALLDRDTTLLSYFLLPDRTLAWVVTRESIQSLELPVRAQDLSAAIAEFRAFPSIEGPPPPSRPRHRESRDAPAGSQPARLGRRRRRVAHPPERLDSP